MSILEKVIITVIVVVLVAGGVTLLTRTSANPGPQKAMVIGKDHQGAYTTRVYTGKVFVPMHHPERWSLHIVTDERQDVSWIDVPEATWASANVSTRFCLIDGEVQQIEACDAAPVVPSSPTPSCTK